MPSRVESNPSSKEDHGNIRHSSGRKRRHQDTPQRSYALAYPAPIYIDKTHLVKHLRSRQFLQIQKVSSDTSHGTPDIDVISFAPPKDPIRFVSALKGLLEGKISLRDERLLRFNKDDVLLTRYREDDAQSGETAQPARNNTIMAPLEKVIGREVIAVLRKDNKIILEDGRLWTTTNHQNRSFEFTNIDEHGVKSVTRWVFSKRRASGFDDHPPSSTQAPEVTFQFSIIRSNSRRHAVLATLTQSALHIKDSYHEPATSYGTAEDFEAPPKVVDDATRNVITATAVWVVLTLGWSSAYKASAVDQQDASWSCGAKPRPSKHLTW
ncbi:hypothetical protein J7T55_009015 [Diaporthe amygdali]|uniref:uncharacterized protein n=1 Tax=Phomopsis amygdali TaxID=1214568 RepID=UPI0022FE10D5|nr:uncharacterized protein J7T55_009015 [Diaporthe amygdali]KAJ0118232.1 hypothetical protein J7T55_009015 [Diaporthe amygdali]